MRVLYFTRSYTSHDFRFLEAMVEAGHNALFLQLESPVDAPERRPLPEGVRRIGWRKIRAKYRRWQIPWRVAELKKVLGETKPDVVHAGPVQSCGLIAALSGVRPLVVMSWGSDLLWDTRRWLPRLEAKSALRRADEFIGDCEAVRKAAIRLGVSEHKTMVFPWGVDLTHFSPGEDAGLRSRLAWDGCFVLLSTRALEPLYGVDVLAQGFALAAKAEPTMRMLVLGQGSLRPRLQAVFEQHRLSDQVCFAGQVDYADLPAFYKCSDLYVSASHSDGSSVSLMEAMACGLPVVASDIAGNREWIQAGTNGWLFEDGNAQALGNTLIEARGAGAMLRQMGAGSRQMAEAKADWSKNRKRLSEAYEQAVAHWERH